MEKKAHARVEEPLVLAAKFNEVILDCRSLPGRLGKLCYSMSI